MKLKQKIIAQLRSHTIGCLGANMGSSFQCLFSSLSSDDSMLGVSKSFPLHFAVFGQLVDGG